MTRRVILVADVASALVKIGRVDILWRCFEGFSITAPRAVVEEMKVVGLDEPLMEAGVSMVDAPAEAVREFAEMGLGRGEAEAIASALEGGVFLSNDRKALKAARDKGIAAFTLCEVLADGKRRGVVTKQEALEIVRMLKEKDGFVPSEAERRAIKDP